MTPREVEKLQAIGFRAVNRLANAWAFYAPSGLYVGAKTKEKGWAEAKEYAQSPEAAIKALRSAIEGGAP